ncbi:MAG: cell division protein FtsI [Desulfotomaculum sp.]|nr:cell division protein FtsI [Desulfotomaculum sp.]
MKSNVRKIGYFLLALLTILLLYLSYIKLEKGPSLAAHPKNQRIVEQVNKTSRGSIFDRNGIVLAESRQANGQWIRYYPWKDEFCHLIGYTSKKYGSAGLEAAYADWLLGLTDEGKFINFFRKALGKEPAGQDLHLTLDAGIQHLAYELLAKTGRPGAAVVIDPSSGAILAAVSQPSFDPNNLENEWKALINNHSSPLLNRAFQGAYPPGSVMKLVTAAGALSAGYMGNEIYQCPGYIIIDGYKLTDIKPHGNINLTDAIALSCNTVFAELGLNMGKHHFVQTAQKFAFNKNLGLPLEHRPSTISKDETISRLELAQAAIGQGELLVSPLHMALVASAVANDGVMMQPYLVQEIKGPGEKSIFRHKPKALQRAATAEISQFIRQAMISSVERGTGVNARIKGITVAGKTGTAENEHGLPHAWFVGFAPAQKPRVAVAVIVENGGSGGAAAAPIAKQLILEALR